MPRRRRSSFVPAVVALEGRTLLDGDLLAAQFPLYLPDGPPPDGGDGEFYNPPAYYDPDSGDPLAVRPNDFLASYPADMYDPSNPDYLTPAY